MGPAVRNAGRVIDAVITAGGRLPSALATRFGTDIKACVKFGGESMLARTVAALRGVRAVDRIAVVGADAARSEADVDEFIIEKATGEDNLLAALGAAQGDRTLYCASDMPFVSARALTDLLERSPEPACVVYPIFVVRARTLLKHERAITRSFGARKSLTALAALFGPALMIAYLRGALRIGDVEARASKLLGGPVIALRGTDPALAFDCDEATDFSYAEALLARTAL